MVQKINNQHTTKAISSTAPSDVQGVKGWSRRSIADTRPRLSDRFPQTWVAPGVELVLGLVTIGAARARV